MGTNYSRYTKTEIAQSVISHVKTDIYIFGIFEPSCRNNNNKYVT